jgi:arabinogalactan endo-1,4-beta-galactosidase
LTCNYYLLQFFAMINLGHIVKNLKKSFFLTIYLILSLEAFAQDSIPVFAKGADIGWLSEMEASGVVFKNESGVEMDCMDILKDHGINSLRFRVWVNPIDGWCNKNDVVTMAKRAKDKGFRLMIDFHYSDWWADPGQQNIPAAWLNDNIDQMCRHLYDHTFEVLDTLKKTGVIPEWVQVGNETNNGMLWPMGQASSDMKNYALLTLYGYNAVKSVDSTIKVIIHLSNGYDNGMYRWMFDGLKKNGAKWDVIGMSLYPYWANLPWQTVNTRCLSNMKDMIFRYNTQVMIVEVGYDKNQAEEAKNFLEDIQVKACSVGGLGVFYWEPESYNWKGYNLGAWNSQTKAPTVALDAFLIDPANPPAKLYDITYKVNMKGSNMSTSNGVYLVGSQTGWTFTQMKPESDSLYSITLKQAAGENSVYYFVTSNSWDNYMNFREPAIPDDCGDSIIISWPGDRLLIVPSKDTVVAYAWGSCAATITSNISMNNSIKEKFQIYPNPAKSYFCIKSNIASETRIYFEIIDISGHIICKQTLNNNRDTQICDISDFQSGIFFVKFFDNIKILEYKKLIIT